MRKQPAQTQQEYIVADGATPMSTTDTQSCVTYANEAFVEVRWVQSRRDPGQPRITSCAIPTCHRRPLRTCGPHSNQANPGRRWSRTGEAMVTITGCAPMQHLLYRTGKSPATCPYEPNRVETRCRPPKRCTSAYERARWHTRDLSWHRGTRASRHGAQVPNSIIGGTHSRWRTGLRLWVHSLVPPSRAIQPGFLPLATLVGAFLGVIFQLATGIPLKTVAREAQAVASGQQPQTTQLDRVDEIGLLLRSVNQASLNLKALLDDVAIRAQVVASASSQIAAGNSDLSGRTETQASALGTNCGVHGAIQRHRVKQNADNATSGSRQGPIGLPSGHYRGGEVVVPGGTHHERYQ